MEKEEDRRDRDDIRVRGIFSQLKIIARTIGIKAGGEERIRKNNKAGRQRSTVQQRYTSLVADVTTCSETAGTVDLNFNSTGIMPYK
ncbi:hypothetical protein EAG_16222 [Camponotus floridanus]|uniref:Uncharacterized protein n=1 Tax=Camponotus floridanus TaxID=104421 RepID=E2AG50_CAMFO|nr:hypothetical protein EAG_16222 [Camponotus floridanus]